MYPGWVGTGWVAGEGYTGTHPDHAQDPYLVIFQVISPTHGQMKAISGFYMRFPEIGSRIDLRMPQN